MLTELKKSIAAGVMIGIGCTVYLSCENKVVGAILFSVGLFAICSFGMFLFTGKIGYVLSNKNKPNCAVIWLGNFIGSIIVSVAVRLARPEIHTVAAEVAAKKANLNIFALVILSFLCGILMYIAVDNFGKHPHELSGIIGIVFCVSVFILCGFEHSIADMNYFAMGIQSISEAPRYLLVLVIISISNGLGAIAIRQFVKEKEQK